VAGHSHWANIKHRKGAADARKGKVFSKLAKFIIIAARLGGGDPAMNARLRLLIDKARAAKMPRDNIERAIKRGTGELEQIIYSEIVYEGYAPGQVAVVVDILTDNKNRTASELRKLFEKKNGTLGGPGSVAWMFETKGAIEIPIAAIAEDQILEIALEAGADDVKTEGSFHTVLCSPVNFTAVREAIEAKGIAPESAEVTRIPTTTVAIADLETAKKVLGFISELEDHEDVQTVSANFDIPDSLMEQLSE
jgi:YebC/PmpR family DNA-binding regulatory protein